MEIHYLKRDSYVFNGNELTIRSMCCTFINHPLEKWQGIKAKKFLRKGEIKNENPKGKSKNLS